MKNRFFIFAIIFILGISTGEVQAVKHKTAPLINDNEVVNIPNEFEKIALLGDLLNNVGPNAIEAGASDDAVYIQFNQTFGNVNISIYNSLGGLVYSTVVNTDVQQVVIIPFSSAAIGIYTVELNNANGYAEGDFEHN